MINIKINTLRVKVIAFGAQSIIIVISSIIIVIINSFVDGREMAIMTNETGFRCHQVDFFSSPDGSQSR